MKQLHETIYLHTQKDINLYEQQRKRIVRQTDADWLYYHHVRILLLRS
jgi:hypothetical protein